MVVGGAGLGASEQWKPLHTYYKDFYYRDFLAARRAAVTYDLRRLRLHGLIARIPKTRRDRLSDFGLRTALFSTRAYARLIRPGLAIVTPRTVLGDAVLRRSFQRLERAMDTWCNT